MAVAAACNPTCDSVGTCALGVPVLKAVKPDVLGASPPPDVSKVAVEDPCSADDFGVLTFLGGG